MHAYKPAGSIEGALQAFTYPEEREELVLTAARNPEVQKSLLQNPRIPVIYVVSGEMLLRMREQVDEILSRKLEGRLKEPPEPEPDFNTRFTAAVGPGFGWRVLQPDEASLQVVIERVALPYGATWTGLGTLPATPALQECCRHSGPVSIPK